MDNTKQLMGTYVAFLRSLYLLHQNHHWQTSGANFYSNHLLFQRIYEAAAEDADSAAEKTVGLFGYECLNLSSQSAVINKILAKYATKSHSSEEYIKSSLKAESDFIELSQAVYDSIKQSGEMTLGLDDMLMAISSKREEACYLLKQAGGELEFKAQIETD